MIYRITVTVTAPITPTEDSSRVRTAIENLFPNISLTEKNGTVTGSTHSLEEFTRKLNEQNIAESARDVFYENTTQSGFTFQLKKQAAYMDTINFTVGNEDELGDIHVEVTVEEPDVKEFIDQIPDTPT